MDTVEDILLEVQKASLLESIDAIKDELLEEADRISAERIIDTFEEVVGRRASKEERYFAMLRSAFE